MWVILAAALVGCASNQRLDVAPVAHIVLIKLENASQSESLIADSRAKLGAIPQVASLHVGRHVDIGRDTIDRDYDVCISVGFQNVEDYLAYLAHPLHVELVEDWRPRWTWIRIHDVLDEPRSLNGGRAREGLLDPLTE